MKELKCQHEHDFEEIQNWRQQCTNLEKQMEELFNELLKEKQNLKAQYEEFESQNQKLKEYIDVLERNQHLQCQGRKFNEVGPKQQSRKLKSLKGRVQCALWFCKSFGLELTQFKMRDAEGMEHTLDYNDHSPTGCQGTGPTYASLPQEEKDKIENVLYLLDKFCVGDDFYHELSITAEGLPESYLIKQMRNDMNKICHLERAPGSFPGSQVSSFEATLQDSIRDFFPAGGTLNENEPMKVKLSGDGAQMSRTTNFMILSFSLLQLGEKGCLQTTTAQLL